MKLSNLNTDCMGMVCTYLDTCSIYNLMMTKKKYWITAMNDAPKCNSTKHHQTTVAGNKFKNSVAKVLLYKAMQKNMDAELQCFGIHDSLLNLMTRKNWCSRKLVVLGSTVVKAIVGATYNTKDIDIYVSYDCNIDKLTEKMIKMGYEDATGNHHQHQPDRNTRPMFMVRTYKHHCKGRIDIVRAKFPCINIDSILKCFDINICRASFDGKKFRIPDPQNTFQKQTTLQPQYVQFICEYMLTHAVSHIWCSTIQHAFSHCTILPVTHAEITIKIIHILQRIIKYKMHGITVKNLPFSFFLIIYVMFERSEYIASTYLRMTLAFVMANEFNLQDFELNAEFFYNEDYDWQTQHATKKNIWLQLMWHLYKINK
jgi:hypothetical protein